MNLPAPGAPAERRLAIYLALNKEGVRVLLVDRYRYTWTAGQDPLPPRTGRLVYRPEPDDASLWASLEADLAVEPPSDPAVARLLPDASRDDPELAQSFRRLTEQDLRERKRDSLGLAAAAMRRTAPVVLDDSEAQALLKGLTDVRLVLAERLGIATDEDAELLHAALAAGAAQGGHEWGKAAELYEVVTYLQEELVHTLLPSG